MRFYSGRFTGRARASLSSEEVMKVFDRVSKSITFWGCGVSKDMVACIEKRLQDALEYRIGQYQRAENKEDKKKIIKHIQRLNALLKTGFAKRVADEYWINKYPIYREKLGSSSDIKEPQLEPRLALASTRRLPTY